MPDILQPDLFGDYSQEEPKNRVLVPKTGAVFDLPGLNLDDMLAKGMGINAYVDNVCKALAAPPGIYNFGQLQTLPDPNAEGVIAWPGLPPETLRKMAATLLAPKIVIQSRVNDVLGYSQLSQHPWKKGWSIIMMDSKASPSERTLRDIREAEQFITNCNIEYPNTQARRRDANRYFGFPMFLALITRDSFVYDGMAVWTDCDHRGRVRGFTPLPAGNIRLAGNGGYLANKDQYAVLIDESGTIYRSFTRDELVWAVRNPRTDSTIGNYGESELSMAARLVDAIENALEINFDAYNKSGIPSGILRLKGLGWTNRELDVITRTWQNLKKGVCFSEDTEVLTKDGWKTFDLTNIEADEFATMNLDTKEFQWQKSDLKVWEDWDGDMYEFSSAKLNLLVTPNHGMLWTKTRTDHKNFGKIEISSAEDLFNLIEKSEKFAIGIPVTSNWVGQEVKEKHFARNYRRDSEWFFVPHTEVDFTGDDFCAFLGMYLSEGCLTSDKTQIRISQFKESKGYLPFKHLLKSIRKKSINGTDVEFRFSCPQLVTYLSQFGDRAFNKFIPDEIMNATPRQIKIFLDYYFLGDGTSKCDTIKRKNAKKSGIVERLTFCTSSKKMADQLQELAQKIGISASIQIYSATINKKTKPNGVIQEINSKISYRVVFQQFNYRGLTTKKTTYKGKIGCVQVPNGTLLVRRNGQLAWSHNTKYWALPAMVLPEGTDIDFLDLSAAKGKEGYYQEFVNMMFGIYTAISNFPIRRLGFRISGKTPEPSIREGPDTAVSLYHEEDTGLVVFLQLIENMINQYFLWSRYPNLKFIFRGKTPREDAREYEIRQLSQTYGERRAMTDNPPLETLIKADGEDKESLIYLTRLMELAPTDPAMTNIFQNMATTLIQSKYGKAGGSNIEGTQPSPGAPFPPKKDPAKAEEHGAISGVRRHSP